jgi:hypothetical protein
MIEKLKLKVTRAVRIQGQRREAGDVLTVPTAHAIDAVYSGRAVADDQDAFAQALKEHNEAAMRSAGSVRRW